MVIKQPIKVMMFAQQTAFSASTLTYLEQCQYQVEITHACESVTALFDRQQVTSVAQVDAVIFYYNKDNAEHVTLLALMQQVMQQVMQQGQTRIPIILITAVSTAKEVTDLLRQQVTAVFRHPLEADDYVALHRCIQRHVNHSKIFTDNARMRQILEQDQQAGRLVQEKLLPPVSATLDGLHITRFMQSSLYLSGDTVDYFALTEGQVMFYLADVSGHGTSSALLAVLVKTLTQNALQQYPNIDQHAKGLEAFVSKLNKDIAELKINQHVTMFIGIISANKSTLTYVVCGHYPMPIIQQHNAPQFLSGLGDGFPLGLVDDAEFISHRVDLADDFNLLVCSDGVLELLDLSFDTDQEALLLSTVKQYGCHIDGLQQGLGIHTKQYIPDDVMVLSISRVTTSMEVHHDHH